MVLNGHDFVTKQNNNLHEINNLQVSNCTCSLYIKSDNSFHFREDLEVDLIENLHLINISFFPFQD